MQLQTTADTLCGGYCDICGTTVTSLDGSSNLPNPHPCAVYSSSLAHLEGYRTNLILNLCG